MRVRVATGCAAALLCLFSVIPPVPARSTAHQPAATKPALPAAAAPQAPADAVGPLQPVLHAQQAKVTTCMDTIVRQSAAAIDGPHEAISSWTSTAPNQNLFVSMVGLSHKSPLAPNGAAVIIAAPLGPGRCEGAVVQVIPSARPCSAVQASLLQAGRTIAMLRGLAVVETRLGVRNLLMPTLGGGCTLVAVGVQQ